MTATITKQWSPRVNEGSILQLVAEDCYPLPTKICPVFGGIADILGRTLEDEPRQMLQAVRPFLANSRYFAPHINCTLNTPRARRLSPSCGYDYEACGCPLDLVRETRLLCAPEYRRGTRTTRYMEAIRMCRFIAAAAFHIYIFMETPLLEPRHTHVVLRDLSKLHEFTYYQRTNTKIPLFVKKWAKLVEIFQRYLDHSTTHTVHQTYLKLFIDGLTEACIETPAHLLPGVYAVLKLQLNGATASPAYTEAILDYH